MKTFKEFKRLLDEDGASAGIGGAGPTNVCAGVAVSAKDIGVSPQYQQSNKKRKSDFPTNPIIEPLAKRANPNGQISK